MRAMDRSPDPDAEDEQLNSVSQEFEEFYSNKDSDKATVNPKFKIRRNETLPSNSPIIVKPSQEYLPGIDDRINMTTLTRIAEQNEILMSDGTVKINDLCSGENTLINVL